MSTAPAMNLKFADDLVWEDVPCPLCQSPDENLVFTTTSQPDGTRFRLVRCRSCGLGYVNPRPDPESIRHFYPSTYRPYQAPELETPGRWQRLRARLEQRILERTLGYPNRERAVWWERSLARLLSPWVGPGRDSVTSIPYHGQGRLLDFGCGSGWFAERMRQRGWQVEGIDFNARTARQAEQTYGFRVHAGTLPHPEIADASFDAINMGSVLEHVHSPHQVIEAATKALRPGGMLAISVPNFDSWTIRRFGPNAFHVDVPRHLLHFSPGTLRRLLEQHGLRVGEVRMMNRVSWMRRTLRNVRHDRETKGTGRWLAYVAGVGFLGSLLTRWTVRRKMADFFLMLAYRSA